MDIFGAVSAGDAAAVDELVAADPGCARRRNDDGVSAVLWAFYVGRPDIARRLAAIPAGRRLDVHELAALDRVDDLRRLLDSHPAQATAVSSDGFTPLHLASFFGAPAAAALLLDHGADVEAVADNEMRVRPLHSAAAGGDRAIVELLLAHGADPNSTQRHGFTPLHAAIERKDQAMIDALLAAGADPSIPRPDPVT